MDGPNVAWYIAIAAVLTVRIANRAGASFRTGIPSLPDLIAVARSGKKEKGASAIFRAMTAVVLPLHAAANPHFYAAVGPVPRAAEDRSRASAVVPRVDRIAPGEAAEASAAAGAQAAIAAQNAEVNHR